MKKPLIVMALFALAFTEVAEAQKPVTLPKRPRDAAIADTNDARAYLLAASNRVDKDPRFADDAFYWASRIDPMLSDAVYGRSVASIMRNTSTLREYFNRGRKTNSSKELRAADSLLLRALTMDPFLYRRFERPLFMAYMRNEMGDRSTGDMEVTFYLTQYLRTADSYTRGWMAYADGNFPNALKLYAEAMKAEKFKAGYHIDRGRIFGQLARSDSAIASFQAALKEMRARDAKDLVILYNSKAVLEHSIAVMLEQDGNLPGAREAYGRALQEDLSYYPAHVKLGLMAFTANDTATALSELELAIQIAPNEAYPRVILSNALINFGKLDRAVTELKKTIDLEPYWALPYATLGRAHERKGEKELALAAYDAFFARANRTHALNEEVQQRRAALKATPGIEP